MSNGLASLFLRHATGSASAAPLVLPPTVYATVVVLTVLAYHADAERILDCELGPASVPLWPVGSANLVVSERKEDDK